jgi:ABC-type branched-subunit amino acid transport system substrate-binding protein
MKIRSPSVSRRQFVRISAGAMASIAIPPVLAPYRDEPVLRVAVIDDGSDACARGIKLGVSEAQHAAALFNRQITRLELSAGGVGRARNDGAQALVFAGSPASAHRLAAECSDEGLIFLNASSTDDALRREHCGPLVFHVAASAAMLADARSTAKQQAAGEVVMWHSSLERFGAAQLNDRFLESQGVPMTSEAWGGWMAVKIIWEAFLRAPSSAASGLAEHLAAATTHFDGHKGVPLSFRSWDHQLRQPLYIPAANGPVTEVPAPSGPDASIRDLLDGIGDKQGESKCFAS